jgi:hypothetical protein
MTVLTPTASIWSVATRITALDAEGYPDPGNSMYVSEQKLKLAPAPVMETGDDVAVKNASGNLSVFAKHGDMVKYGKVTLDLAIPDPAIEALLTGGVLLGSAGAALGTPSAPAVEAYEKLVGPGALAEGTYGYRISSYNSFGETLATAEVTAKPTGAEGATVIVPAAITAGAIGVKVYGRVGGIQQFLGTVPNIGKQKLATAIAAKEAKKGAVITIKVTALTESIPKGTIIQVKGDTSAPKALLKTTIFGVKGATTLEVENLAVENSAKIEPEELIPVFVDLGTITPEGNLPQADTSAGPGENLGMNASELGPVGNENGVSIEVFQKAIVKGVQAQTQPFVHWVFPRCQNFHILQRDLTNGNTATSMEGEAFQNPNWGSGPVGDWPFASTRWYGRARCGRAIVPKPSFENQLATL